MADSRRQGGGDRARGRYRDADNPNFAPRGPRDRPRSPEDSRHRSRSPRRDRGERRERYRSRSRDKDTRDNTDRGDRDRERGDRRHDDRGGRRHDRDQRDSRPNRSPPRGPRGAPPGPRKDDKPSDLPSRPVPASRAATNDAEIMDVDMKDGTAPSNTKPDDMDDETWEMKKIMGFTKFKSTKNTKVEGNDKNFGVRKEKKMEARQYMNRQGGFNRPLSPSHG